MKCPYCRRTPPDIWGLLILAHAVIGFIVVWTYILGVFIP